MTEPDNTPYRLARRDLEALVGRSGQARRLVREAVAAGPDAQALEPEAVRGALAALGFGYPFQVVAFINLKGGVGKTTSAVALATRAAQYGFRTCLLDLDSQGSASIALDREPGDGDPIFYDVWQDPAAMLPGTLKPIQENLAVLPSSLENALLETSLVRPAAQKQAVRGVCNALGDMGYDLVVADCPPSLGAGVISAVCAAHRVVIPTGDDAFSFRGMELTFGEVEAICETFGLPRPSLDVLLTRLDRRVTLSRTAADRIEERYRDRLLPVAVRTSTEYSRALERRETVFAAHGKSNAREDYDAFAREVLGLSLHFGRRAGR